MAAFLYASTPETTNLCRVCRLLLGPCTDQIRDVLRKQIPPPTFPQVILQKEDSIPRLTKEQRDLILPSNGNYSGTYNAMDISLMYTLLRNVCGITAHKKGWGKNPDLADRSLSASIERIRTARNRCVHSSSHSLSNSDFNTLWSEVRSAVVDLDAFLNNGNKYEREVDFLRHESMDPERDHQYMEKLQRQVEQDRETKDVVQGIKRKLEEIDSDVQKIGGDLRSLQKRQKSTVPDGVKAIHKRQISKWKEEDKIFVETHNFPAMMRRLMQKPYITIVGGPGSGKSATAHHIALKLRTKLYEIVPIKDIWKIENHYDHKKPQVFVLDDVVGVFGLQEAKLNHLSDYEDLISNPLMPKSKIVMTCREAVFRNQQCSGSFISKKDNVVFLHSDENSLNNNDKENILRVHGIDINSLSRSALAMSSEMFPFLCKLYSTQQKYRKYGSDFFQSPVAVILKEMDNMQKENKIHYIALVLCMMNGNKLSKDILECRKFNEIRKEVFNSCEIPTNTDAFRFTSAMSEMEGTYTKRCGKEYSFVHDSMFEITARHFGRQPLNSEIILRYMDSSYIANYIKPLEDISANIENESKHVSSKYMRSDDVAENERREKGELFNQCIIDLPDNMYPVFSKRLYSDIENMKLYDVFVNDVLKHPLAIKAFIDVLQGKTHTEVIALFLLEQSDMSHLFITQKIMEEQSETPERLKQKLLIDERQIEGKQKHSVRVISWMIYYGHHQILQYIIERTKQQTRSALYKNHYNSSCSLASDSANDNGEGKEYADDSLLLTEQTRLLVLGCYSGDVDTVKILLKHVDTNAINKTPEYPGDTESSRLWRGVTPLTAACSCGHVLIVQELLKDVVEENLRTKGDKLRRPTSDVEHLGVIKAPLDVDPDVNINDQYQEPLTENESVNVVEKRIDINLQSYIDTPLTAACTNGHYEVVKILLDMKANVNLQGKYLTPLTAACESGHLSVVDMLLTFGADLNLHSEFNTPLTAACENGNLGIVKVLLKKEACVNLKNDKFTPLIAACAAGHVKVVEELIKRGADVNMKDEYFTPLTVACKHGHVGVVSELLKENVDVNLKSHTDTPLIAACKNGHLGVVKELCKMKADVNKQGELHTPLSAASERGHLKLVKELLKVGADVNLKDGYCKPLIRARNAEHGNVVRELVRYGANINPDDKYETPLSIAQGDGQARVVTQYIHSFDEESEDNDDDNDYSDSYSNGDGDDDIDVDSDFSHNDDIESGDVDDENDYDADENEIDDDDADEIDDDDDDNDYSYSYSSGDRDDYDIDVDSDFSHNGDIEGGDDDDENKNDDDDADEIDDDVDEIDDDDGDIKISDYDDEEDENDCDSYHDLEFSDYDNGGDDEVDSDDYQFLQAT